MPGLEMCYTRAKEMHSDHWRDPSHSLLSLVLREPDTGTLLIVLPDIYAISEHRALLLKLFGAPHPNLCSVVQITHLTGSL